MHKVFRSIKIIDGVVVDIAESDNEKLLPGYERVPEDWNGRTGDKADWFDPKTGRRYTDDQLVAQGKRKDNRGRWYNKTTRETKNIDLMDVDGPGDEWTKEAPLPNEPYQKWDEKKKWIIDTEKKERAEKEQRLGELDARIREIEDSQDRPLREKELGIEVDKATKLLKEYQAEIEKIRPERNKLEAELKKSA